MAYKFDAKLEDILKIVYSEDDRIISEVESMKQTILELDELKKQTNSPARTSQRLWDLAMKNNANTKYFTSLIELENACILLDQYLDFMKKTKQEMSLLYVQFAVPLDRALKKEIPEVFLKNYHNLSRNDCNEILRYIRVWEFNGFIRPKYDYCVKSGKQSLYNIEAKDVAQKLDELGYANYIENLKKLYNKKLDETIAFYNEIKDEFEKIKNHSVLSNTYFHYQHPLPFDYNDGSRAPIGSVDSEAKLSQQKRKFHVEYREKCANEFEMTK